MHMNIKRNSQILYFDNLQRFLPCHVFTLSLPGDIESRVTLCELFGAHIHSSTDFFKSALKCLQKKATFVIHFPCNKLESDRPHRKKSTVHKKPLLIALSEMQSSQQAYTHQIRSGLVFAGGAGGSDPRTLCLYHTCSPAILPPDLFWI